MRPVVPRWLVLLALAGGLLAISQGWLGLGTSTDGASTWFSEQLNGWFPQSASVE